MAKEKGQRDDTIESAEIILQRSMRARQKTVLVSERLQKVFQDIYREEATESDWRSAIEYVTKPELPALPEPAQISSSPAEPTATDGPAEESARIQEMERKAFFEPPSPPIPLRSTARDPQAPRLVGFLVSYEADRSGESLEIREGRWIVSSVKGSGNRPVIHIDDASVSECHATLRARPGLLEVADQFSELGSGVVRKNDSKEDPIISQAVTLQHGDELRLGGRRFSVCLIESPTKAGSDVTVQ